MENETNFNCDYSKILPEAELKSSLAKIWSIYNSKYCYWQQNNIST